MTATLERPVAFTPPHDPCRHDLAPRGAAGGERIRVLELVATGSNGGAQESVLNLLARVDRTRFDVRVISLSEGSSVRKWRATGIPVDVIEEGDDDRAVDLLTRELMAWSPEIIHGHMYRAEIIGVRAVMCLVERGLPRPFVVNTIHSGRIRPAEDRALLAMLTPEMDRLIAVSRSIVAKIRSEGRTGVPTQLIYNGVDLDRYDSQEACCTLPEEYGFAPGTPLVGVVARLEPEKGHQTLLEAWPLVLEAVQNARLLIVGSGSRREALEAQAESLGLLGDACVGDACVGTKHARPGAKVVFTGRRDDVPAVTAALDVAVLPSYREAQGLAILEAMALGRPVVASRVGGIPEIIRDGLTGVLVAPHDPEALAGAIVRVLTDHPFADTIARAGRIVVHDRFCVERMVSAIEGVYEEGAMVARERGVMAGASGGPRSVAAR